METYRKTSPASLAAMQLAGVGKAVPLGQTVRFLYLCSDPGVHAWNLPAPPDPARLDIARYTELFLLACLSVLQMLGFTAQSLRDRLLGDVEHLPLWEAPSLRIYLHNARPTQGKRIASVGQTSSTSLPALVR